MKGYEVRRLFASMVMREMKMKKRQKKKTARVGPLSA